MGAIVNPQLGRYFVVFDSVGNPILVNQLPDGTLRPVAGAASPEDYGRLGTLVGGLGSQVGSLSDTPQANELGSLADLHQDLLGTKNLIATGEGSASKSSDIDARRTFVRKPWLDPPDNSRSFDPSGASALGAVLAGGVVVSHTVPEGWDGVINAYSWNYVPSANGGDVFTDGSGDIVVSVLKNGAPIPNYGNITVQKGCIQIARPISPIRTYSNQVISIFVTHAANAALQGVVIASLEGFDYPSKG